MSTTNRLWQVVAAAGLALLAVLLTTFYVTNYKRHVQHSEAQVSVVLAAKDIPVDTPGSELLSGNWLTKQTVPRRQVVPGAISSPEQLRDLIAAKQPGQSLSLVVYRGTKKLTLGVKLGRQPSSPG